MKSSPGRAIVGVAAATVAATTLMVAPLAGPAAADVVKDCSGFTSHQDLSNATNQVRQNMPVRSGPYGGCTVRWRGPAQVNLHCWVKNDYNSKFWFVVNGAGERGFVFEDNLNVPTSSAFKCEGHVMTMAQWENI